MKSIDDVTKAPVMRITFYVMTSSWFDLPSFVRWIPLFHIYMYLLTGVNRISGWRLEFFDSFFSCLLMQQLKRREISPDYVGRFKWRRLVTERLTYELMNTGGNGNV